MPKHNDTQDEIRGELLDERLELTLREVCSLCGTERETVVEMVREGIAEPVMLEAQSWTFTGVAVRRLRAALRLQHDLELNLHGAALALDLLDEIERLRRRLAKLPG